MEDLKESLIFMSLIALSVALIIFGLMRSRVSTPPLLKPVTVTSGLYKGCEAVVVGQGAIPGTYMAQLLCHGYMLQGTLYSGQTQEMMEEIKE